MPLIRIDCVIPAPPAKVWAVLADFDRYEAWNPLNVWACGQAGPGARIDMRFRNLASPRDGAFIRQTVRLVACEPERELAWAGAVPLLFHGRHGFLLTPHRDGTHCGAETYPRVKRTPSLASWSRWGVRMSLSAPCTPKSAQPWSSE